MSTNYPGAIDSFTNPRPSDALSAASALHSSQHINANDSITAIQTALGTYPGGGFGSVVLRFAADETATANLQSQITSTNAATAALQTQVSSLWNSKIPYTGASANVTIGVYSFTAASVSTNSITSRGTVSALTLSAGNMRTAKVWFDDGTSMNTAAAAGGVPYTGASAGLDLANYSFTASSISALSITSRGAVSATTVSSSTVRLVTLWFADGTTQTTAGGAISGSNQGAGAGLFKQMSSTTSQFKSVVAGDNIGITVGTDTITLSANVAAGMGVPYVGATANMTLGTYGLTSGSLSTMGVTATSLSSQGITGTTLSAVTLLAGNFQSATAGLASGTGNLQSAVSNLYNAKVPYTGATADVNLSTYNLTAGGISAQSITSRSAVSAVTVSASTVRAVTVVFADGSSQTTGGGAISGSNLGAGAGIFAQMSTLTSQLKSLVAGSNIGITVGTNELTLSANVAAGMGVPYNGATANVSLGTYGLTAGSLSTMSITSDEVWAKGSSGRTLRMGQFNDGTATSTYSFYFTDAGTINWLALRSERARADFSVERRDATTYVPVSGLRYYSDYLNSYLSIYDPGSNTEKIKLNSADISHIAGSLSAGGFFSSNITGSAVCAIAFYNSVSALTDEANISTNALHGNFFRVTLSNNRILANPTNGIDGQKITWAIRQPSTGGAWTIGFDTKFRFGTSITGMNSSTGSSKTDYVAAVYSSTDDKWDIVAVAEGY